LESTETLARTQDWGKLQIQAESMWDLKRYRKRDAHKDPSNNSLKEIPLKTASNPTNGNSSKNTSENLKKKNARDFSI
jgi:hypothetical protein